MKKNISHFIYICVLSCLLIYAFASHITTKLEVQLCHLLDYQGNTIQKEINEYRDLNFEHTESFRMPAMKNAQKIIVNILGKKDSLLHQIKEKQYGDNSKNVKLHADIQQLVNYLRSFANRSYIYDEKVVKFKKLDSQFQFNDFSHLCLKKQESILLHQVKTIVEPIAVRNSADMDFKKNMTILAANIIQPIVKVGEKVKIELIATPHVPQIHNNVTYEVNEQKLKTHLGKAEYESILNPNDLKINAKAAFYNFDGEKIRELNY